MGALIAIVALTFFIILFILIWNNLSGLETEKKITICIIGVLICIFMTLIIFQMSSIGIEYPTSEGKSTVRQTLLFIFAPINGIILIPYFLKNINNAKLEEQTNKKFLIFIVMIIAIFVIEIIYFKNIQLGIIKYSNTY